MRILFSARPAVLERTVSPSPAVFHQKSPLESVGIVDRVTFSGAKPKGSPSPELCLVDNNGPLEIWGVKDNIVHPKERHLLPELNLADKVTYHINGCVPPKVLAALRESGFKVVLNGGYYSDLYPPKPGSNEARGAKSYQQLRAIAAAQRLIVVYGKDPDEVLSMSQEDLNRELDNLTDQEVNQEIHRQYPRAQLSQGAYLVKFDTMGIPRLKPNIEKLIGHQDIAGLLTDEKVARKAYDAIRDAISQRLTGKISVAVWHDWAEYGGSSPKMQIRVLPPGRKGQGNQLFINGSADYMFPANMEGYRVDSKSHGYPTWDKVDFPFFINMGINGLLGRTESNSSGLDPDSEMGSRVFSNSDDFLSAYEWDYQRVNNNIHKPPRDLTQCQTRMELFSNILKHYFNPEDSVEDITAKYPATSKLIKGKLQDLGWLKR